MNTVSRKDVEQKVSKGAQTICRARRIMQPKRVATFCRSVTDAVMSQLPEGQDIDDGTLKQLIEQQFTLLKQSLDSLPKRKAEEKARVRALRAEKRNAARAEHNEQLATSPDAAVIGKTLEEKLADYRESLSKLIRNDCVTLGLLSPKRAEQVCVHLAGKTPEAAEKDVIAELRNNLHKQLREIIRKQKGGPWKSVKAQEELRVEIAATSSLKSVIKLTRHLLRERDEWEKQNGGSGLRSLFSGRLKFS